MATNQQAYSLLRDAYYGDGIFFAGKGLRRHPRESIENYRDRQGLAYYLNYTGPIVDACTNPVFRDEIRREYRNTAAFAAFLDNCDRIGTDLQDFMRRTAKYAKLYGAVYVLVNNTAEGGRNMAETLADRRLPYLTLVYPEQLVEWEHDESGSLASITWREQTEEDGRTVEYTHTWTTDSWLVEREGKAISAGQHGLQRVPVVRWCGRTTDPQDMQPTSEFISVAQANYFLFQVCSWHTQILRDQAFSILTLPDAGESDITIGTNNLIAYPPDSAHAPAFISPSADPAQMLEAQEDRLIREMYRMTDLSAVIGVQEAKSGVAKRWEFERTNQKLADFALQCEQAELEIISLYERWTGENIAYFCEYPRDFRINDIADSLAEAQAALDLPMNAGATFRAEVMRKVLAAYMPNIDPAVYDDIMREMQESDDIHAGTEIGDDDTAEI